MIERYRFMTPEECARSVRRRIARIFIIYLLALGIFSILYLRRETALLNWLYDYYIETEAYNAVHAHYWYLFLLGVIGSFIVFAIVTFLQEVYFTGILNRLCDPEKYAKAELIRREKSLLRRMSKRSKVNIGVAYQAMCDYENAGKYFECIIPASPDKVNNKANLCRLASYYHDIGDEKAAIYKARLEAMRSPGRSGLLVELTLDNIAIEDAIREKRYDEAKNLISKYINSSTVSVYTKTIYQYYLGVIAFEEKDYPEAIYRLKTSLETGEKLPIAGDAKSKLNDILI